jgi:exonuclease III
VFGSGEDKYKFWWSGEKDRVGGAGVLARDEFVEQVIEVERITPRIMKVKKVIENNVGNIISLYAPQTGSPEREK